MTRAIRTYALFTALTALVVAGCEKKETASTSTDTTTAKPTDPVKAANDAMKNIANGKGMSEADVKKMADDTKGAVASMMMATAVITPSKNAATQPSNKAVAGTVTFTGGDAGVKVVADLTGLSPGKHGIHIHEKADISDPALKSAGGHWNPDKMHHGGPTGDMHHSGDLGNIEADASGKAHLEVTLANLTCGDGGKHDVVGHSVIVHAGEDDLKTDPAGNSGDRVAGGAIEGMK